MNFKNEQLLVLLIFNLLLVRSENIKPLGRDYYGYSSPEEDKKFDSQIFQYPSSYPPGKDGYAECENNPMLPFIGKALNFFVLKLGVLGIVKAVVGLIFLGIIAKLPIVILKLAFLKSFFLPFLVAPILIHMFTNHMNQPTEGNMEQKPSEIPTGTENMMVSNDMNMNVGRQLADNLTSVAWQSVKMFVESDQCMERMSCMIGASNVDLSIGKIFSRSLKFFHYSSSPSWKEKISSIKEAFIRGSKTLSCSAENFKCESPELIIQHGPTKVKIL